MKNTTNKIEFNEKLHEYRVGGILTPSVSHILKANGLFDNFRRSEPALSNGTAIHKALELHDLGSIDYETLDKRLKKCIDLWEKFKKQIGIVKILEIEKQLNFGVLYAGTMDRLTLLDTKKKLVLDYKSGNPQPWAGLQTGAYAMAYDTVNFRDYERCCAQVHWDNDNIKYKPYTDQTDFNTFMAMATVYHWKKNNGYLREDENGNN